MYCMLLFQEKYIIQTISPLIHVLANITLQARSNASIMEMLTSIYSCKYALKISEHTVKSQFQLLRLIVKHQHTSLL